jgi:hypothetical protein
MSNVDHHHLHRLLAAWNDHQDLRRDGAPLPELYASRIRLDAARDAIRHTPA